MDDPRQKPGSDHGARSFCLFDIVPKPSYSSVPGPERVTLCLYLPVQVLRPRRGRLNLGRYTSGQVLRDRSISLAYVCMYIGITQTCKEYRIYMHHINYSLLRSSMEQFCGKAVMDTPSQGGGEDCEPPTPAGIATSPTPENDEEEAIYG
jgi:hypothetical protein